MTTENLPVLRDRILQRINALGDFLDTNRPVMSVLMATESVTRHDERKKEINTLGVDVQLNAPVEDIIRVLSHLAVEDIETLSSESTKITRKYPGLVIVPGGGEQLSELICSINEAKNEFAAAMRRVDVDKNRRFDTVHKKLPGLVTLQSTRKILYVDAQLKKVTFSWRLNKNQLKKDSAQLISILEGRQALAMSPKVNQDPKVLMDIETALEKVKKTVLAPGESYRVCRVNSFPVPIAHLFTHRPEGVPRAGGKYEDVEYEVVKASMPIFASGRVPDVKCLTGWEKPEAKDRGKERTLTYEYTELVPGAELGIYIARKL